MNEQTLTAKQLVRDSDLYGLGWSACWLIVREPDRGNRTFPLSHELLHERNIPHIDSALALGWRPQGFIRARPDQGALRFEHKPVPGLTPDELAEAVSCCLHHIGLFKSRADYKGVRLFGDKRN